MGHSITAVILKGEFDADRAKQFDLFAVPLGFNLSLFHIDHYYSAYWQYILQTEGELELSDNSNIIFPSEFAIYEIIKRISCLKASEYAIITTDYFGGIGKQYASVFYNASNADKNIKTINQALRYLGVISNKPQDEFETVGLYKIRSQPEFLEKYIDLADKYGL